MTRRPTIFDRYYGQPPGTAALIQLWNNNLVDTLLDVVWNAYDQLHADFLCTIPWGESYDDVERSITQVFEQAIQRAIDPYLPCRIQHSPAEHESRKGGKAQPPLYDLAFIWNEDTRIMWPLEAKVLKTDKNTDDNLGDYISTLNDRFLTGKYAPFSPSGAMLGYLKPGDADAVLHYIEVRLGKTLVAYPRFEMRNHKTSDHMRTVPQDSGYPINFRCHHMILPLG